MATTSVVDAAASKEHPQRRKVDHCPRTRLRCIQWLSLCKKKKKDSGEKSANQGIIVYVLGGPGCGKGTQCSKIAEHFGFTHLSVGEVLETEVKSGSETGKMIQDYKKEGKLVPSEVVVKLLQQAMQKSGNQEFVIDGFPRNEENRLAAEKSLKIDPNVVLVFDCSEDETIRRILQRNQGRVDDNIDTIRKRLKVYHESTVPVIDYYIKKGKVRKIDANRPIEEVFQSVKGVFAEMGLGKCGDRRANVRMAIVKS